MITALKLKIRKASCKIFKTIFRAKKKDVSDVQEVMLHNSQDGYNAFYPYKLLSDKSGLLTSGARHISGHKLPCSRNKVNIFSSRC